MADIARPQISTSPSRIGSILTSLGKFAVDSTLADFLSSINGRKRAREFVQREVKKGNPLPPLSSNYNKRPGDVAVIVHDVQEVVKKGQGEAVKLHERCDKSSEPFRKMPGEAPEELNLSATKGNRVFIRSRL